MIFLPLQNVWINVSAIKYVYVYPTAIEIFTDDNKNFLLEGKQAQNFMTQEAVQSIDIRD